MSTQKPQNSFEQIYNETYNDLLKFIILKCNNFDDVNDIIQETYTEFYKALNKTNIDNYKAYLYGIAKNKIKKYYHFKDRMKSLFINKDINDTEIKNIIADNFNLEEKILNKISEEEIWNYLNNKNIMISKVFFLYYSMDINIKEIGLLLHLNESTVKNHLYRTLKELNKIFGKENRNEN